MNGHIPFAMQQQRIPVVPGEKQDIYVKTYFDVTQSIKSDVVDTPLSSIGFLPSVMSSSMNRKGEIHSILLRLLFNPAPELCQLINSYTEQFADAFVIGLQLRMGGKLVNAKDPRFLSWAKMTKVVEEVKAMIKKRNSTQPVIVFVSTDSLKVRQYVVKAFAPPVRVMYVKEFSIGHTALIYKSGSKLAWDDIMKQAIMDMMVLKDCDYLAVASKSSYGKLAMELQQSYGMPVSVDWFLKEHGMRCSVFNRKKSVGVGRLASSVCYTTRVSHLIFHNSHFVPQTHHPYKSLTNASNSDGEQDGTANDGTASMISPTKWNRCASRIRTTTRLPRSTSSPFTSTLMYAFV